mgnify:FL=1
MITRGNSKYAYLAGAIDSDGSISVIKSHLQRKEYRCPRFVLEMTFTNTSKDLMDWIIKNFAGSYRERKYREKLSRIGDREINQRRIAYGYKLTAKKALPVLKSIEPYLVGKKRQAQLAIEFQENLFNRDTKTVKAGKGISHYLSEKEILKRTWYSETIQKLNKTILRPAETERGNPYLK